MTRAGYALLICSLVHAVAWGIFVYRPSPSVQLFIMALVLGWPVLLLSISAVRWSRQGGVLIACALAISFLVAPFLGSFIGGRLEDAIFRQRLPEYESAVRAIQQGEQPAGTPRLAYAITPGKSPAGDTEVLFYWGGGFPVKHTGFLYSVADPHSDPRLVRDWKGFRALAPNWYYVVD